MTRVLATLALLAALPALAQEQGGDAASGTALAQGVVIRGLDKVTGQTTDLTLAEGETARLGRIEVTAGECRYPADDPASNAYAWLSIRDDLLDTPAFEGWMIAAAPALNALDHARYDVWVIRCNISGG